MTKTEMSLHEIQANSLLASTFDSPREVLANPFLDDLQKQCILTAWASDTFAVESKSWLRMIPGSMNTVPIGDILDALNILDGGDDPPDNGGNRKAPLPKQMKRIRAVGKTFRDLIIRRDCHA